MNSLGLEQIKKNEAQNRNPLYAEIDRLRAENKTLKKAVSCIVEALCRLNVETRNALVEARDRAKEKGMNAD